MKPGDIVGERFRIEKRIAAGGMGVVFRAHDEQTGFAVAVKLFDIRTEIDVERAHRESQSLARLAHPGIVAYVADGVTPDGQLFLVMEWIDGMTVLERLRTQGFSLREVAGLGRRIASALAAVHGLGILHRDVKPSNVLLPDNQVDTAMLVDFGVVRIGAATEVSLTRTGIVVGTPGFMSPEQARGQRALTPAVDVFGLGCMLYLCATGEPAFAGATPAAILAKILFADIAPIQALCPDAPPELSAVIAKMMARDVEQRYPDARSALADLDRLPKIPDGAPRLGRRPAARAKQPKVHCIVMASSGPRVLAVSAEAYRELIDAANLWDARLEMFENGDICAHLEGDPRQTTHRAACLALAMRRQLPGWAIAVSTEQDDVGAAAETGSVLLTSATILAVAKKLPGDAIVVDRASEPLLREDFALGPQAGAGLALLGRRR